MAVRLVRGIMTHWSEAEARARGLVNRAEAARLLHLAEVTICRYERAGRLVSWRVRRPCSGQLIAYYALADLERIRKSRKAHWYGARTRLFLRASELFERGASISACVEALGLTVFEVRDLYDEWKTDLETGRREKRCTVCKRRGCTSDHAARGAKV